MKRALLLSMAGLLFFGSLFASEIFTFRPEILLPKNINQHIQKALLQIKEERRLEKLLQALKQDGLRTTPHAPRHHIIPPKTLLLAIPDELQPWRKKRSLLQVERSLKQDIFEYDSRKFHELLVDMDAQKALTTKDITDKISGGWKWNISKDVKLVLRGSQEIVASYGFDSLDQNLKEGTHVRRVDVHRSFRLAQNLNINLIGRIGPRISITIDHNSQRNENKYDITYKGQGNEIVKQIKAGNVALSIPSSKYVVYSGGSKAAFGVKGELATKRFKMQAVLSMTKGISETKSFKGQKKETATLVRDVNYIKHRYFQLPDRNIDANSLALYRSTTETNNSVTIGAGIYKLLVPGTDYSFSQSTGQVQLAKAVSRDQNLLASYTAGGSQVLGAATPGITSPATEIENDGKRYLYLKRVGYYSRFERKGIYNIGYNNIDVTRGFEFYVVNTSDGARSDSVQFNTSEYRLNPQTGILEFFVLEPFDGKPNVPSALYHSANDPLITDSVYSFNLVFLHQVSSFQLRFNMVPGSERIKVNNNLMTKDVHYRIDYMTGTLTFITAINENDTIEASYEYKPFSGSLQRTLLGVRADYKIVNGVSVGSTLMYSGGQKPTGAPHVTSTPNSQLIFDIDGRIDLLALFGIKSKKWTAKIEGEFAYSIHDKNTVDRALFADMESDALGYAITRTEDKWQLGSVSPNIDGGSLTQADRGRLLYRDYRDYGANDSYSVESYTWGIPADQIYSYTRKPGPYMVKGGRNESTSEITENSLVLEYDFSGGKRWVSVVSSIAGAGGLDLSRVKQFLLSVKHQRFTGVDANGHAIYADESGHSVKVYFELGNLNEDADGDTVFDREETISSGGFVFNPSGGEATYVGGGRRNGGNGTLDSEDLNRDNVFQTTEQSVVFPSSNFTTQSDLTIPTAAGWQEYTLVVENLGNNRSILERVSAIRITIVGSSEQRGRLLIDRAYFKGARWDVLNVNNVPLGGTSTTNIFTASIISTRENSDYKNNRIYTEHSDDFEDLHGRLSKSEEEKFNEKALQVKYNIPGGGSASVTNAAVTKVYNNNMDLSFYKRMAFYVYIKEKSGHPNEYFLFRLGNSVDRYYEWRIPLTALDTAAVRRAAGKKAWHKIELRFDPNDGVSRFHAFSDGVDLGAAITTGKKPNLREINRATVGMYVPNPNTYASYQGEFWVNEAHMADDKDKTGSAYSIRGEFSSQEKTIARLFGVPLLGPFSWKFDVSRVGQGFRSIGQTGIDEDRFQFSTSMNLNFLRYLNFSMQYSDDAKRSEQDTEVIPLYLQYASTNVTYKHTFSYNDPRGFFPNLTHSYSRSVLKSITHQVAADTNLSSTNESVIDSQKYQYSESATFLASGKLPFGIKHSYTVTDSYFLTDVSVKTNGVYGSWFTNNTTQAYATYAKTEKYSVSYNGRNFLGVRNASVAISGSIFKQQENYDKFQSQAGMRDEFNRLEQQGVWSSYVNRMQELLAGVNNISSTISGTNMSAVSEGFNVSASLKNMGFFSLNYSLTKSAKDSNFLTLTNNSLVRNNASSAKSILGTELNFKEFFLRQLAGSLTRDFSFTQTAGTEHIDSVWSAFNDAFFAAPFKYLGLFGGGRENDLSFVNTFKDSGIDSYVKLRNSFVLSGKFNYGKTILQDFLPDHFTYTLTQYTERALSSYIQNRSWNLVIGKDFPLKKLGFWIFDERSAKGKRVGDLNLKFLLGRSYDYNAKTIADDLGVSLGFAVRWSRYRALTVSYAINRKYTYQSIYSTDDGYHYMGIGSDSGAGQGDSFGDMEELSDGSAPAFTEQPALTKYNHVIKINYSFPSHHSAVWNLFGLKIPIDTHWKHRNEITINFNSSAYDRNRAGVYSFSELFDRIFYLKLSHSIDYDFTKSWNGVLYLTMIFEKWQLSRPAPGGMSVIDEDFGISFGLEFGLKMKLRF